MRAVYPNGSGGSSDARSGQAEKNSIRAHVFRFALNTGHRSMQSALRIRAITGSGLALLNDEWAAVVGPDAVPVSTLITRVTIASHKGPNCEPVHNRCRTDRINLGWT